MSVTIEVLPAGPVNVAARGWAAGGRTLLTVIVKSCFRIVNERPMEPMAATPLAERDVPRGQGALASIKRASDLGLFLRRAEITLDATVFAPKGKPVEQAAARLIVARGQRIMLSKELRVLGDRTVLPDEAPGRPLPFDRMPIIYERAYGGLGHADNPAGVGATTEGGGRITMPNIVLGEGARSEPAGFGPISSAWPARRGKRGSLSREDANEAAFVEIPRDFDEAYYQSAPADQQLDDLLAGDSIAVLGMHPDLQTLRTALPARRGTALARTRSGVTFPVPLRLDTVFFEPLALRAELVFRGAVQIRREDLVGLRVAGAMEEPTQPFKFPDFDALSATLKRLAQADGFGGAGSTADLADPSSQRRAPVKRDATVLLEPEPAPAKRAPAGGGTMIIEPTAPVPHAPKIGGGTLPIPPRGLPLPGRLAPPPAPPPPPGIEAAPQSRRPPRRPDATLEIMADEPEPVTTSMPFEKRPKRSRSSASIEAQRGATPWSPGSTREAPEVRGVVNSTMIVDIEEAPPSQRSPRRRKSGADMPAVTSEPPAPKSKRPPPAAPPPPPQVEPEPEAPRKKASAFRWGANAETEEPAKPAPPAPPPPKPVIQPAPDRKAQLYKKFKPR